MVVLSPALASSHKSIFFHQNIRSSTWICGVPLSNRMQVNCVRRQKYNFQIRSSLTDAASVTLDQILRRAGLETNEATVSLLLSLGSQISRKFEEGVQDLATDTANFVLQQSGEATNLEELFMQVPNLETIPYSVVVQRNGYSIRKVEGYTVAETSVESDRGFDFFGSSQAFNTLAGYLFGKNSQKEEMAMTTPVIMQKKGAGGQSVEVATPATFSQEDAKWRMAFVIPSTNRGSKLPVPSDGSVRLREVPAKFVAVTKFSGFVSDDDVRRREVELREALLHDDQYKAIAGAQMEVAQYNPPFTLPFLRRNEISVPVELKG